MPPTNFEIPMPTLSLNQLNRMHYHAVKHLRDRYTVICRLHTSSANRARPHQHRRVTITRHGVKLLDYDNLVGGCKPLVDALNRAGLLWDDSPRYCQVSYRQEKTSAGQARTVVVVS